MGRKRINRTEVREPITISLPRNLIISLDSTLHEDHTRSRLIESLVKKHLDVNTKLTDFEETRHEYYCTKCDRCFERTHYVDPDIMRCRIISPNGKMGCNSYTIRYWGEVKDGEEE